MTEASQNMANVTKTDLLLQSLAAHAIWHAARTSINSLTAPSSPGGWQHFHHTYAFNPKTLYVKRKKGRITLKHLKGHLRLHMCEVCFIVCARFHERKCTPLSRGWLTYMVHITLLGPPLCCFWKRPTERCSKVAEITDWRASHKTPLMYAD